MALSLPSTSTSASASTSRPLTLVSHHLSSFASASSSRAEATTTVPTSHPLYEDPLRSSADYVEHSTTRLRVNTSDGNSSYLVLARAIQGATALELSIVPTTPGGGSDTFPNATPSQSRLFLFPAPLLSGVSLFYDNHTSDFYIVALTVTGWLYRLRFPLPGGFYSSTLPHDWAVEHRIAAIAGHTDHHQQQDPSQDLGAKTPTLIHAADPGIIIVACRDGTVVKLEQSRRQGKYTGRWSESTLRSSSFFKSVSRLFTRSANPNILNDGDSLATSPTQVVSAASHLFADVAFAFCLSRDRKLRVWDLVTDACLRTLDVVLDSDADNLIPFGESGTTRPFMRIVELDGSLLHVLVYIPGSLPSGSHFALYAVQVAKDASSAKQGVSPLGDVSLIWSKRCDKSTDALAAELRDAQIITSPTGQWNLWTLWNTADNLQLKVTPVNLDDDDDDQEEQDNKWQTVSTTSNVYTPLFGPRIDEDLVYVAAQDLPPFFTARVFESGRFSMEDISTALDTYCSELISSMSSARLAIPPVLEAPRTSFPCLADQMASTIGCTVRTKTDPQTGALQSEQYRLDLIKEWRKFIAVLDDVDTRGRWPIQLIVPENESKDQAEPEPEFELELFSTPLVLTRDRIFAPVQQDIAAVLVERTSTWSELEPTTSTSALQALTDLATKIHSGVSDATLKSFTEAVNRIASQPLTEDIQDVTEDLYESETGEFIGSLAMDNVGDVLFELADQGSTQDCALEAAFWRLSDILVHHCNLADKITGSGTSTLDTTLGASLLADGAVQSLRARLRLAQALAFTLLRISGDPGEDEARMEAIRSRFTRLPWLLVRMLDTVHRLSVLVAVCDMTTEHQLESRVLIEKNHEQDQDDAIANQLQGLNVGDSRDSNVGPGDNLLQFALLRKLLSTRADPDPVDEEGPLSFASLVHSGIESIMGSLNLGTMLDSGWQDYSVQDSYQLPLLPLEQAMLAHDLVMHGYANAALHIVSSYPAASASHYIRGKALLLRGRADEAADAFAQVMKRREGGEDDPGYKLLLPVVNATLGKYGTHYRNLSNLFDRAGSAKYAAWYARLALEEASSIEATEEESTDSVLRDLHFRIFRCEVSLGEYESCYTGIMSMSERFDGLRRDCIRTLVSVMCEDEERVGLLLDFNFAGLQFEVERNLSFKARNSDPRALPNYYTILYSYHMKRGDHKSGAAVMYQQGYRFGHWRDDQSSIDSDWYVASAVQEARSYLACLNALKMVKSQDAWIADASHADHGGNKSGGITSYIPLEHWQSDSPGLRIIRIEDVEKEYHLSLARLEVVQMYPELRRANAGSSLGGYDAVSLFVRNDQFDRALLLARSLSLDRSGIFSALALKCATAEYLYRANATEDDDGEEEEEEEEDTESSTGLAFLGTNERTSSWQGKTHEKGWRYLRLNLEMEDRHGHSTGWKHRLVVLRRLLMLDGDNVQKLIPTWLTSWYLTNLPEVLIKEYISYGYVDLALEAAIQWVETTMKSFKSSALHSQRPQQQCISYGIIDTLLNLASNEVGEEINRSRKSGMEIRKLAQQLREGCGEWFEVVGAKWKSDKRVHERSGKEGGMEWH
ncbi:unnamed protein product [Sympodiomycopsis kandeliae]